MPENVLDQAPQGPGFVDVNGQDLRKRDEGHRSGTSALLQHGEDDIACKMHPEHADGRNYATEIVHCRMGMLGPRAACLTSCTYATNRGEGLVVMVVVVVG